VDRYEIVGQEQPVSVVTLVSGGVDSTVVAALGAKEEVEQFPLFIDYGQLAAEREWVAANARLAELNLPAPERMDLKGFGATIPTGLTADNKDIVNDAFLPGRNLLLITAGAAYGYLHNASAVAIGLLNERTALFPDQTAEFIEHTQRIIEVSLGDHIEVVAPLMSMSKDEVLRVAEMLGISNTYSCHAGLEKPCGRCISCMERDSAVRRMAEG
jgi:7-cyano-7-deazaguanine synthase